MMEYGLIGERLPHSFSPFIHGKLGDYSYVLKELGREELEGFIKAKEFKGINVTVPYKEAVIPYLDEVSPRALAIGAVNTVVNRGGKTYGYNTDIDGIKALINRTQADVAGKKVLILGTGGTSKTAYCAVDELGAGEIIKVSRSEKDGAISYSTAKEKHKDAALIINTTPCGMYPNCEDIPLEPDCFTALEAVVDVIYNPLRTRLVRRARALGIKAEGGLYMLVKQAVKASELFLGTNTEQTLTERVYRETLGTKENIVLIGMPSSGKTTVGGILARHTGRPLYDTDVYLEQKHAKSIPQIFMEYGESSFRDMEAEAVKELSVNSGCIIATGGGAVLRKENVDRLKQNGRLYFLDRPLEKLVVTDDRPLSRTAEALEQRYKERYPIYKSVADEHIDASGTAKENARIIAERHGI